MNGADTRLRQSLSRHLGRDLGQESASPIDFAFLSTQTSADLELERDVLELFVAQVRGILPGLKTLPIKAQLDTAHLLKGSARGIGAWAAADAAEVYEAASPGTRQNALVSMTRAFEVAEIAIEGRLADLGRLRAS